MAYASTAPEEIEVTWGLRDLVYGVLIALAGLVIAVAIIVAPAAAIYGEKSTEADVASAASQILLDAVAVGGVFWLVRRSGGDLGSLGLRLPSRPGASGFPWGYYWRMVSMGLVLSYVALFTYVGLVSALGFDFLEPSDQIPKSYLQNDVVVGFLAVGVVLVAPFCEEVFFRGFVFGGLKRMLGFVPAGLISGLVFASAHTQLGLIIPFAGIGFIFAFVYHQSRSLFVSMSVHFLFNLISFSLLVASAR